MARPKALAALPDEPPLSTEPVAPPATVGELQAVSEGVKTRKSIEFMGEQYQVADKVAAVYYWAFAEAASDGLNLEDMSGIAAAMGMLRDCFVISYACETCDDCREGRPCLSEDLGDWPRFHHDVRRKKADNDDLMKAITQAMEVMASRPFQPPSDSSSGRSTTSPSSTVSASSPATPTGMVTEKVYRIEDLIKEAADKKGA